MAASCYGGLVVFFFFNVLQVVRRGCFVCVVTCLNVSLQTSFIFALQKL